MRMKIKYYSIQSDHILAIPAYSRSEIVDVKSFKELQKYIESQKDGYGHKFKKKKSFGFDYTSVAGAVKVESYKPPKVKKI